MRNSALALHALPAHGKKFRLRTVIDCRDDAATEELRY
jgi:hypothetical protein